MERKYCNVRMQSRDNLAMSNALSYESSKHESGHKYSSQARDDGLEARDEQRRREH